MASSRSSAGGIVVRTPGANSFAPGAAIGAEAATGVARTVGGAEDERGAAACCAEADLVGPTTLIAPIKKIEQYVRQSLRMGARSEKLLLRPAPRRPLWTWRGWDSKPVLSV